MSLQRAVAFAPASVGNCAVGFDLIGHALEGPGDRVTAVRMTEPGVRIDAIRGLPITLPREPDKNTAARAVASLLRAVDADFGITLDIDKGIPLGSGMGGSAASAVAALVAANALLAKPLPLEALYPHALEGEFAASGGHHGDNVAPSLLGGLVIAAHARVLRLPTPEGLHTLLVHPDLVVETRLARERLRAPYGIAEFVPQSEALALFLSGLYRNDLDLLRAGLKDVLVEPRRADLIPGFAKVKQALLDHGAYGASIAGAGPSVFGWFATREAAAAARADAEAAFAEVGLTTTSYVSPVAGAGARIETCS